MSNIPKELFDGFLVQREIEKTTGEIVDSETVADVLDAVVKLIRERERESKLNNPALDKRIDEMKGQILDIYPEGADTFRACVLEGKNNHGLIYVVNLDNGKKSFVADWECEKPIINNIFDI